MVQKRVKVRCEEGTDDCTVEIGGDDIDFDCGGDECEVRVECADEGCSCTVNGESTDCSEIPGVPHQ